MRDAAAGFRNSADRRIDAELALIRLCEVEASLDARDLNARLSRLENRIAMGVSLPANAAAAQEPPESEDRPPWEELERDIPPEPGMPEASTPPQETDSGEFWKKLIPRLRTSLRPPAMGMFSLNEFSPVKGSLREDVLTLLVHDMPTKNIISKPEVLQIVAECAAGILGRPVKVQVKDTTQNAAGTAAFDRLAQFASQHSDIIDLK